MTAQDIVERINKGEVVTIPRRYAFEFMRECERHDINARVDVRITGNKAELRSAAFVKYSRTTGATNSGG